MSDTARNLTWAVNAYGECTVYCLNCRKLIAEDVSLSKAHELTSGVQCGCAENGESQ